MAGWSQPKNAGQTAQQLDNIGRTADQFDEDVFQGLEDNVDESSEQEGSSSSADANMNPPFGDTLKD